MAQSTWVAQAGNFYMWTVDHNLTVWLGPALKKSQPKPREYQDGGEEYTNKIKRDISSEKDKLLEKITY